ncbi:HlyD family secretion protein [Methylobacterium nigriterrae]|uniref:HlyD family secretion protein n=1 Tax=Methylobacterium nigriterrae TaxID=3127512 RepID=UPI0030140556
MRAIKLLLGALLLLGGLYILVGEHFAGTSSDATVNARMAVVRAPIEGEVSLSLRGVGSRVGEGESVANILDDRFDTARLNDLERSLGGQNLDLKRVQAQRAALNAARKGYETQVADYQQGRVRQIEARIAEAQAAQEAANARLREADASWKRANELNERGVQTAVALDKARSTSEVAKQDLESARQRANYLRTELASARNGVFIGDSYNDAPFSSQRIRDLDLRIAELSGEEQQIAARLAQTESQIAAERVRVNKLTSAELKARSPSMVWDFLVDDGEYVRRGQDLVRLVDCSSLMVTASVTEALYDGLRLGGTAQFRFYGDDRIFDATITRLGGSGAAGLYANLAVGPSAEHLKRFDVALTVPALAAQAGSGCAVGRTGRVIFTQGPLGAVRAFATRYGF